MTPTPKISIIVPVYNVEMYLSDSLDSIRNQTFTDWECLLVDDGSTDGSDNICDQYAALDPRFRVIHQRNGGLSAARNSGLRNSVAPLICFVDSDDTLRPEFLARLYELITTYDTDMAQLGMAKQFRDGIYEIKRFRELIVLNRKEFIIELLANKKLPNYVCGKIFRREVIGPDFPEGMVFEDLYTFSIWARKINSAVLSPEPFYLYRQRKGSILHNESVNNRIDYLNAVITRLKSFQEIAPDVITPQCYHKELWKGVVNAAKFIARNFVNPQVRLDAVRQLSQIARTYPAPQFSILGVKRWWRAKLLLNFPKLFIRDTRMALIFNRHRRHRSMQFFD